MTQRNNLLGGKKKNNKKIFQFDQIYSCSFGMGCKIGWNSNFKEILIPLPVHQTRHNKQLREQNAAYASRHCHLLRFLKSYP